MGNRHVVPGETVWRVEKEGAQRASATTATQAEAVERAREIIANEGGGELVIHAQDGAIRESRTISGSTEGGPEAAGAKVQDQVEETIREAGEKAMTVGRDLVGKTRKAAGEVAGKLKDTVRRSRGQRR